MYVLMFILDNVYIYIASYQSQIIIIIIYNKLLKVYTNCNCSNFYVASMAAVVPQS